ncbi:unnamed protein product [Fusarium graminearum]|uniref:DUF6594 domain-containing protein n=1 Tax=Gibberella zeae TaxID=5518 RepID=A0A4E9E047_GIBZA|nr:hypothetical protein HG531_006411 [Fusarium graminearum]CAF3550735.1 unnamed protein product [Fusarium graminearum]CAF3569990.1 unnamed protein product [Fusarium graminearum]CAG1985412.1 unnamed protein product [Fusarium graminearum]
MSDRVQARNRPSWSSAEGASIQKALSHQSTVEDCEESASQSPSEGGTQRLTPTSSSSKTDHTPSNVQRTVTQLTSSDNAATSKQTGNRSKNMRETRNPRNKGAHRPSSMSFSGPDPNAVAHDAFQSSPEAGYFKSPLNGRQVPAAGYAPSAVAVANYPQSPISPLAYPVWGPSHTPAGYPPQEPFTPQQPGLPQIDHHYPSRLAFSNQRPLALEPAYHSQNQSYDPAYSETQEDMAAQNDDLPIEALDGYAEIAARLSGQCDPRLRPLYRKFDWLNHRALLYLQDQLGAYEEELIRLDSITTRHGGHMAVSGREERASNHDIHRSRNRLMDKIDNVLRRYRHLVVSLEEMQKLPAPTSNDVQTYRNYLDNRQVLVEEETRFLRAPDLVALSQGTRTNAPGSDQSAPAPLVPLRTLISAFSMSGLCLAVLLMVLPDIMTRLVMVLCYLVLIATVLSTTGHLRRLRQLFEG